MTWALVLRTGVASSCAAALVGVGIAHAQSGGDLACLIVPRTSVSLSSPIEGVIDKIHVERGSRVEEGQVLVELEAGVERATLALAQARAERSAPLERNEVRLRFATRMLERSNALGQSAVISPRELDEAASSKELAEVGMREAKEERQLARLEVERAREALGLHVLQSPIRGVVVKRLLEPGEFADERPILELAQIDPLRIEVFAPLELLGRVAPGAEATVLPEHPVGGSYTATVTVVDPVVDPASGTFGVLLELANPDGAIPAGVNCKVRFGNGRAVAGP